MYGGKRHVVLDYGLELAAPMFMTEFNPVHGARDYECTKEAATWEVVCKVKSTGTTPSFWHGNGSSKYTFAYLMFEMGYLEPPEVQLLKEAGEAGALLTGKDGMLTMPGDPRVDETVPACEAASGESGGAGAQ